MKSYINFVIWGTGERANRLSDFLGNKYITAYIDSDINKLGSKYKEKPVISFNDYIEKYRDELIVISILKENEVIPILERAGINWYLRYNECPSEMLCVSTGTESIKRIWNKYQKDGCYGIYGLTPYSLYLYNDAQARGMQVQLIADHRSHIKKIQKIKEKVDNKLILSSDLKKLNWDEILLTCPLSKEERDSIDKIAQCSDVYDLKETIQQYRNEEIKKFKNIHKGKRIFIVATGPSLKAQDVDILYKNKEICISMNRIHNIYSKTNWRPQYYMITDRKVFSICADDILKDKSAIRFISDSASDEKIFDSDNIYSIHCSFCKDYEGKEQFSCDLVTGVYCSATVTYACIQLAAYMGASEIYLLGVDFSYIGNPNKNGNHFYEETTESQKQKANEMPEVNVKNAYESAKYASELYGFKVFNATRGGKLEIFERINFDSLFNIKD